MSLVELLPKARALSRAEQLQLIQVLAGELAAHEAAGLIESGRSYPVWSPDSAFDAAAVMLQTLKAEKAKP